MKKVRLMLLSFTVLATVGAALAFNANGLVRFCTAAIVNNSCINVFCANDRTGNHDSTFGLWMCTTPTSGNVTNPCPPTVPCNTASAKIRLD